MHKGAVKKGQRVLLLDDLIATGGTMGAGIKLIRMVASSYQLKGISLHLDSRVIAACGIAIMPSLYEHLKFHRKFDFPQSKSGVALGNQTPD